MTSIPSRGPVSEKESSSTVARIALLGAATVEHEAIATLYRAEQLHTNALCGDLFDLADDQATVAWIEADHQGLVLGAVEKARCQAIRLDRLAARKGLCQSTALTGLQQLAFACLVPSLYIVPDAIKHLAVAGDGGQYIFGAL